jgi:ketosteroid isomerase-like protein
MSEEDAVKDVLERYARAIGDKDAAAVVACYTDDVVAYDLAPPLAIPPERETDPNYLDKWFATWDGPIVSVAKDMHVRADNSIAYAFALRQMSGRKIDGENVSLWFRATATLVKEASGWKISHVHNSVPFAMDGTGKAELGLKP